MSGRHTASSTLAACVAQLVGAGAAEVPLEEGELRIWLAEPLVPAQVAA
ncbi:MAG: hypothetical protein H0V81_08225 [Solirubrobacterales bacterium]|nr:hypothetical protein [Solirubrobacterales bacterium]